MSKKVAVILSGCGVFDGSEIYESVITLLELDKGGADVTIFAPDISQLKVVNHQKGEDASETRSVMTEAARLARGPVTPLSECSSGDFDALILPGGFGAALNLCTFAVNGPDGTINADVESAVKDFYGAGKPVGAMCIAPVVIALALKNEGVELTIGNDEGVAGGIEALGNKHVNCSVDDIVTDESNKIVTTPAYMLAQSISEANSGISKLVKKILELA